MQLFRLCLLLPMFVAPALAADAENGKRLAEARCVTCHMVAPSPRREVAAAQRLKARPVRRPGRRAILLPTHT